jgi:ADP-ribose pyrophosphatase YjhB (NUDIX family)
MNYCSNCGSSVTLKIPEGDDRPRFVCTSCNAVHYENPKVVVGCIPEQEGRILLCKRDIEPKLGKWTLPAGYLENNETLLQGAIRETMEETNSRVEIIAPYRLFDLAFVSQVYLMFRARLLSVAFKPTTESSEIKLFTEDQIPWNDIAFQVIGETLKHYLKDRVSGTFIFQQHEITESTRR